jgi:hypothetical protein
VHLDLQMALKKQSILAEPNRGQCVRRNAISLKASMVALNSVRYLKKIRKHRGSWRRRSYLVATADRPNVVDRGYKDSAPNCEA